MRTTLIMASVASIALAGCELGQGDPTNSRFVTPSNTGVISEADRGMRGADRSSVTGNTYGYQVGSVQNDGLQAFAGIASGARVSAPPTSGTASFNGTFELAVIDFILSNGTQVSGQSTLDRGDITLTADFDAGRLTGGGTGLSGNISNIVLGNNVLSVDGVISGETLSGTVTYDGVSGPLRGLIGSDEVIGAFHGHTNSQTHAGGFIAN